MHIIITGPRGIGKSTLIQKLIQAQEKPIWGYFTKKEPQLGGDAPGDPIYIYPAGQPRIQTEQNLVGHCNEQRSHPRPEVFDAFAREHLQNPPRNHLIVMDEIGFMESKALEFKDTVLRLFDDQTPILAAVKDKSTPFLEEIRNHPNCQCFHISETNRDALYEEILNYMINKHQPHFIDYAP